MNKTLLDTYHIGLVQTPLKIDKHFLIFQFPEDKKNISKLSYEDKMEWYAYQFERDQRSAVIMASTPEFESFWKWRVLMPVKLRRLFYRIKNGEIFKKYHHITEIRKKVKPHSI